MRQIDQISHITQAYGRGVASTASALLSMIDARTGLVTVAVWAIADRANCGEVQCRRDLHLLAAEDIIEIDANQPPDALQTANTYRWVGVGAYEPKRFREARRAHREQQRERRLQHNEGKRAQRTERVEMMIARRIGKGIRDGIALYWQRHAESFAPLLEVRVLQESSNINNKSATELALEGFRARQAARLVRR